MNPQLFPRPPRRMKQPAKDVLREQLVTAADELIRLRAENLALRDSGSGPREELAQKLVEAASALGHYETLRSSDESTIDYWRERTEQLRAALATN